MSEKRGKKRDKKDDKSVKDLIIIGAGPAGITASIYAARRKLDFLVVALEIGGQVGWSPEVENYPGLHHLTGLQLVKKFKQHLKDYPIQVKKEEVKELNKQKDRFTIKTDQDKYKSKSIIIASGKKPRKLGVPGEEKLSGKGVSYCAACDAPLFKDEKVAVIGGGNAALESSLFLADYAEKVYLLDINKELGGTQTLRDRVKNNKKIEHINKAHTKQIIGKNKVRGLEYQRGGQKKKLDVKGVIIEIGLQPRCKFAKDVKKNKWSEIKIHRSTKTNEENMTNIKGVFAAGDVTDIPAKQIIAAAGEGCKAALACFDYLEHEKK